jgi:hypothetical protein
VIVSKAGIRSCKPPGDKRRRGNGSPNQPQPLRFDAGEALRSAGAGAGGCVSSSSSGTYRSPRPLTLPAICRQPAQPQPGPQPKEPKVDSSSPILMYAIQSPETTSATVVVKPASRYQIAAVLLLPSPRSRRSPCLRLLHLGLLRGLRRLRRLWDLPCLYHVFQFMLHLL